MTSERLSEKAADRLALHKFGSCTCDGLRGGTVPHEHGCLSGAIDEACACLRAPSAAPQPVGVWLGGEKMALAARLEASAAHCDQINAPYAAAACREAASAILSTLEQQEEPIAFIRPEDLERLRSGESIVFYALDRNKIGIPIYAGPNPAPQPAAQPQQVTEEMVERVARALAAERYEDRAAFDGLRDRDSQVFMTKDDFRHLARAALTGTEYALHSIRED